MKAVIHTQYGPLKQSMLLSSLMSKAGGKKMAFMGTAKINHEDLVYLGELLEAGKLAPVIDRRYPLREVADAFRYFEGTHPQGNVVITME